MTGATPVPAPPAERLRIYVDGANLYWGLHDEARRRLLWLDLVELGRRLRPRSRLVGVSYFVTPVADEPEAQSRQAHYLAALRAKYPTIVEVVEGRYQTKTIQCRGCRSEWPKREEKETDVNVAVNLVADAAQGLMEAALIVSADSDLAPAVRMVRRVAPSIFVAAAFPPRRFSKELKALMPASFAIGANVLRRSQLPEEFTCSGLLFRRPAKWC